MHIVIIGHNNRLKVDIYNQLSKCFQMISCGFEQSEVEQALLKEKRVMIVVCLKGVKEEELQILDAIRQDERFSWIKILVVGFVFEINFLKNSLRAADKICVYPVKEEEFLKGVCSIAGVQIPPGLFDGENSSLPTRMRHILVVDDDARMLRAVKSWLDGLYKVSLVNSAESTVLFLKKQIPDLVLLDYQMPTCDGAQTLEMIRKMEHCEDLPVVFLTGVSDKEKITRVMPLNPRGYILKGITREEMIMKLNGIFQALDAEK